MTTLSRRAQCVVDKIHIIRKALPPTMLHLAEQRLLGQLNVADATNAALYLAEENKIQEANTAAPQAEVPSDN